ncbi:ketopantoate reductase C-terminal domain-containing protein [Mesorhizobium sp.]|uniref:ketopantoate reductase C-terminal domain-containing protein n=1 Tax=Mesorhizobium sp. TaxID=1871066 RepID=UPI0025BB50F2|nr:ketopantoate reductase C-terminal domain-containing protein [Mesorhizobium sp.]
MIQAHPGISAGAASLENQLVDECVSAATAAGHPLDDGEVAKVRAYVSQAGSTITTSMLREIENDSPIEADQIIGDMMRRASSFSLPAPILSMVHAHLGRSLQGPFSTLFDWTVENIDVIQNCQRSYDAREDQIAA